MLELPLSDAVATTRQLHQSESSHAPSLNGAIFCFSGTVGVVANAMNASLSIICGAE